MISSWSRKTGLVLVAVLSSNVALAQQNPSIGTQSIEPQDYAVLYPLRDLVFSASPGGRRAIDLFYRHWSDILDVSLTKPAVAMHGVAWIKSWNEPLNALVEETDATLSESQVTALLDYVEAMKAAGSDELRTALDREQQRMGVADWAGLSLDQFMQRVERLSCADSDTALCLNGGRFRIEAEWRTLQGRTGRARAVPLTADTGAFWFFDEQNLELVIKTLDACAFAGSYWVFAAGLTDVEVDLTVADTESGEVRRYTNALSQPFQLLRDTSAFPTCGDSLGISSKTTTTSPRPRLVAPGFQATEACQPGPETLCLEGGRYRVTATWSTQSEPNGRGQAVPLTGDTGAFWFFDDENLEVVLKVLDGCGVNGNRWVFAAGLTDVAVSLVVTDTVTGRGQTYDNSAGSPFSPIQDTDAFPDC